jgi:hypothetical protein
MAAPVDPKRKVFARPPLRGAETGCVEAEAGAEPGGGATDPRFEGGGELEAEGGTERGGAIDPRFEAEGEVGVRGASSGARVTR